jgi:hypothetical protein
MESRLSPRGATYIALLEFPLNPERLIAPA